MTSWRWSLPVLVEEEGVGQTLVVEVYILLPPP